MGIIKKWVFYGIVLLYALFEASAQSNLTIFSQKFDNYQSIWPKTKLHLIFNQDKFSPGDTVYFKAYFLTEDLNGVVGKQLIELNLLDLHGQSKLHIKFNVFNGIGHNQLALPDRLSPGIYLVTAHSNWMKNFSPALIFKKEIIIVRKNVLVSTEKPVLRAVAEGGHLIRDISNKISIRSYRAGSTVQIIDGAGQEIGRTTTDINGVGSIIFTPMKYAAYYLRIDGDSIQTPLPKVEDDGCSLRLSPARKEKPVKILITSPPASALREKEIYIIVSARGKIFHTVTILQGARDFVEIKIPQQNLPEGITHVSLLNKAGNLLASRDFYSPGIKLVQAKVETAKQSFQTREKVMLEVTLTDRQGQPVEGEFSIKVLNAALFDIAKKNSLTDELNILYGVNERFLIDRSDANWMTSLDNYLISVSEDVPWNEILSNKVKKPLFTFTGMIQKRGRAYFADTFEPVPDFTQILFYLQREKMLYQTSTSEKGKFKLVILDLFDQDEFFYMAQTSGKVIPNLQIVWEEDPIKLPRSPQSMETDRPDLYASFFSKSRLIERSYSIYTSPEKITSDSSHLTVRDFEEVIKGADITINVQNYISFSTMGELLKEVIQSLYYGKIGQKSIVRVKYLKPTKATDDPLYVIDGIATKNTDFFLSLKPSDLLTVKIVTDPYKLVRFGLMGKNGIVMVQTIKGDVREPLDDPSKLIEGLNRPVNFKTSDYSNAQDHRRPDFRSTVHWNPSVKTDSNGKAMVEFFCSDDVGKLSIRIDGLASEGRPFSAEHDLEVMVNPEKK
ncbi:MAG: hypothetical protein O7F74_07235 [Bacteroidetes bacterium]|nr:hypothetical protein [Bacteroidota bacterium]